jgi:hypothetical protein
MATAFLLPLPACGERVGVRGSFRTYRARGDGGGRPAAAAGAAGARGDAPSPDALRASTSPRKRGEVKIVPYAIALP